MSVLARMSGGPSAKFAKSTMPTAKAVSALFCVGLIGWGIGARAGYGFAQKDAAAIMRDTSGSGFKESSWREWMAGSQQYEPPSDLAALMTLGGGTIPGTGGMTTGDIWNGYQMQVKRQFFNDND